MLDYSNIEAKIKSIKGPVAVFGAGGFIGVNLLNLLLKYRDDVMGISQDHINNWRFIANNIPHKNLASVDILQPNQIRSFIKEYKPKTIFNLAAYGAYSKQNEYDKIYQTNFVATIDLIEVAKEYGFDAFVQTGSSSEYGLNSAHPEETKSLLPNSHYAVSKAAVYQAIKYYGMIEKLPIAHLRLYSVYGPWEEPDRLIPVIISAAQKGKFPSLVNPEVSRDFVYIDDVLSAFIDLALACDLNKGNTFNIGMGKKTTIKELANLIKKIFNIDKTPEFGSMPDRNWDVENWFANTNKANKTLKWKAETSLDEGLKKVADWQKEADFDNAYWNWTK